jgi:hypothetical protein
MSKNVFCAIRAVMLQGRKSRDIRVSVAEARGQLGNSEEGERPPLEIVTGEAVKTETEDASVCVTVICKLK